MSITEAIREFMCSCPLLSGGRLNVDYLSAEPREYAIIRTGGEELVHRYADGGKLMRFDFLFASREWIAKSVDEQLAIAEFYEKLALWLEEKTAQGELPTLEAGLSPQSIRAISAGSKKDHAGDTAKYQMECRLIYLKEE